MNATDEKLARGFWERLSGLAKGIDDALRFGDFRRNRTVGGYLDRCFGIKRHSCGYLIWPALVAAVIVMGVPECALRLLLSILTFAGVCFVLLGLSKVSERNKWSVYAEMGMNVAVVLAVAVVVWVAGGDSYSPGVHLYRHFFVLAAVIVGVSLLLAGIISMLIWKGIHDRTTYREALRKTELFISRGNVVTPGICTLLRAALTVVPGAPMQLLLLPAIFALISPADLFVCLSIAALVISYVILLMGGFDARLNYMWHLFQNGFFRGGALIVSLIIIALAAARLFGVSYVTTLLDTAEGVVIAVLLLSAYIFFWWYNYWVGRLLTQELLKLFGENAGNDARIPYDIDPTFVRTSVLPNGRVLQIHGSSRFIVIGLSKKDEAPRFQAHDVDEVFDLLACSAFPGGKAKLSPAHIREHILDFKYLTALMLLGLSVSAAFFISRGVQMQLLAVDNKAQPDVRLAQLLFDHGRSRDEQPALIIAASGGGTRAALYTASVLEGLARRGRIQDVMMGSGVSGGGASLAYFAGQRTRLIRALQKDWDNYFKIMSMPFIQDVINGASQWRIVSSARLGLLLSESFEERWHLDRDRNKLGDVRDFGLILNTAIAGRFKSPSDMVLLDAEHRFRKNLTRTDMAGGRLILTNLALGKDFVPQVVETGGPEGLPVVVHDPATRLETAAALNANFPPVFSNAAVDIGNKERYWVTDGGAVDNRGIEMPLYALYEALRDPKFSGSAKLPAVTVVVLDASAFSNQYSQDRGVGTMMGAGTQYASLLVEEQLRMIRKLYHQKGQADRFRFIYLPMPLCLRKSGSFGTHWMLQPNIEISLGEGRSRNLKGHEMVDLLRAIHTVKAGDLSPGAEEVLKHAVLDIQWRQGAKGLGLLDE